MKKIFFLLFSSFLMMSFTTTNETLETQNFSEFNDCWEKADASVLFFKKHRGFPSYEAEHDWWVGYYEGCMGIEQKLTQKVIKKMNNTIIQLKTKMCLHKIKNMYQKIIITLVLFIFANNSLSYAQENNYTTTYKVNYLPFEFDSIPEKDFKKIPNLINHIESSSKHLSKINFILEFNKRTSVFSKLPLSENYAKKMKLIKILLEIRDEKYYSNPEITINQKNSYGQDFLVNIPKIKWNISNNSKKIGPYTCYKATTKRTLESSSGNSTQNIVAWFTPDLPFNFGPKQYNGLPGLIIKLKEGENLEYILTNIKKKPYKEINFPKKGKNITLNEFKEISKKMYKKRS